MEAGFSFLLFFLIGAWSEPELELAFSFSGSAWLSSAAAVALSKRDTALAEISNPAHSDWFIALGNVFDSLKTAFRDEPGFASLRYGDVLVRIFIVYFFLTGISFMLASYASDQPGGGCDNYELSLALQLANPGHSCDRIGGPAWSKFFFSTLLCLQVMGADRHCSPLIVPDRR